MFSDPSINAHIEIEGKSYYFTEAPNAPGIIYAEIGRKAKVYRLVNGGNVYALKVFKPRYRTKTIVENTRRLKQYQDVLGLCVANRTIINPEEHQQVIEENKSFAYAVVMPWIEGKSWFNYVTGRIVIQREESLDLALALVRSVNELEKRDLAHCDLSSSNFIFSADFKQVELIDIEDLFGEGLKEPEEKPAGTGGYAPDWIKLEGIWEAGADRFSMGILISEIIGWQFEDVRQASGGETYFGEGEFGKKTQRYQILADRLEEVHPGISTLFKTVWYAKSIEECPRVRDWKDVLEKIKEPELLVTPECLAFGEIDAKVARSGGVKKVIEIRNAGGGMLGGQIRSEFPWLRVKPIGFRCGEGQASQHEVELVLIDKIGLKKGHHLFEKALCMRSNGGEQILDITYNIIRAKKKIPGWALKLSIVLVGIMLVIFFVTGDRNLRISADDERATILSASIKNTLVLLNNTKSITSLPTNTATKAPTVTATLRPSQTFTPKPTDIPLSALLYSENFENGKPENWIVYGGTFEVVEEDNNHFWRATGLYDYPQAWYETDKTENWTDYAFESRIRFVKGAIFICVRSQFGEAFFNSAISSDNWIHIAEYEDGNYQVIAESQKEIIRNKWYLIRVEVQGNRIRLFIDNKLILSAISSSRTFGGIGFYLGGEEIIDIDSINVWSLK